MDILLVGGSSQLMKKLCLKLHKEGHRVYVLTGSKNPSKQSGKVYECYHFSYDSLSIKKVFENLHPDVTIFMGAYDGNYLGENPEKEGISYLSGLQNLLLSWSALEGGRLIFLSSVEVFSGKYENLVSETSDPSPKGYRPMMLYQAEQACLSYAEKFHRDVVVLRLDWMYDIARTRLEAHSQICGIKCLDAFRSKAVSYREGYAYGLTYLWDAVLSIYDVISCKQHKERIYHISSSRPFSEKQIVKEIQKNMNHPLELLDDSLENPHFAILDNKRLKQEFGFLVSLEPEQMIEKTMDEIRMHTPRFLEDAKPEEGIFEGIYDRIYKLLRILCPYILNVLFCIAMFILEDKITDISHLSNLQIPVLYILIFSVIFGQRQAVFACVLSGAIYLYQQMQQRFGMEVMMDVNTYIWLIQNFVVGLLVGHMKDQLHQLQTQENINISPKQLMDVFEEDERMEDEK